MSSSDQFFTVDLAGMEQGVRSAYGLNTDGKFLRQKEHLAEFGKIFCFRILLPTAESIQYYNSQKVRTLPFAAVRHAWFTHPTKQIERDGEMRNHRFFHVSPTSIGEHDKVDAFLEAELASAVGYHGAPLNVVDEKVTIFRSFLTNKNPKFRHLNQPKEHHLKKAIARMKSEYPDLTEEEYSEAAKSIRYIWQLWQTKYFMPIVMVSEELDEETGQSIPLTNQAQILDFQGALKNCIFHAQTGLIARNLALASAAVAKTKREPFQAYNRFLGNNAETACFDIFIECFENRQFVGDSDRKGYADYRAWFRDVPTTLKDGEAFYSEEGRINLLEEVKAGIKPEQMVIDSFKVHFGDMDPKEFNDLYESEDGDNNTENKANEVAQKAKQKAEDKIALDESVSENTEEDQTETEGFPEAALKIATSIAQLEELNVEVPESLLTQFQELCGLTWQQYQEVQAAEEDQEEAKAEEPKKKSKTAKASKSRKRAKV